MGRGGSPPVVVATRPELAARSTETSAATSPARGRNIARRQRGARSMGGKKARLALSLRLHQVAELLSTRGIGVDVVSVRSPPEANSRQPDSDTLRAFVAHEQPKLRHQRASRWAWRPMAPPARRASTSAAARWTTLPWRRPSAAATSPSCTVRSAIRTRSESRSRRSRSSTRWMRRRESAASRRSSCCRRCRRTRV